jgi:mersacidin/lichenicidin family type 2 lantibiotic
MSDIDIIRAWKDEEYRKSLTDEQRASIPPNPAGKMELTDMDMSAIAGGTEALPVARTGSGLTMGCCSSVINECGFSWYLGTYGCCPISSDLNC